MTQVDWHPYPDTTPKQHGEYLATYKHYLSGETLVGIYEWTMGEYWDSFDLGEVIAWAELPGPYDPEGE